VTSKSIAIEFAQYLKRQHPNADIAVRDLATGETIAIKSPTAVK
jgi:FMN-dependent NADH-azoreductase